MGPIMRRILNFACEGATCFGTLDVGDGTPLAATTGLLIVSGGNEVRVGSHRGMAKLAADLVTEGFPAFRFDRRGIGDSAGTNNGFESSGPDIAAALNAFRAAQPQLERVVAFGNCDAATALLLHRPPGIDALMLTNPWIVEVAANEAAPATARAYYADRLRSPRAWLNLLTGHVNIRKTSASLQTAVAPASPSALAVRVAGAMRDQSIRTQILLAAHDGTAVAFADQWAGEGFAAVREAATVQLVQTASHSFAATRDYEVLRDVVLSVLRQE